MKAVALIALFFVAGSCVLPASEVAAPSQDRFMDLWFLDFVQRLKDFIERYNLDPVEVEKYDWNIVIFDELFEIVGFVEDVKFTGAKGIRVNSVSYNIVFGRFDVDVEIVELRLSIGKFSVSIRYGNVDINLEVSGTVVVKSIRLTGHSILSVTPGSLVVININPDLRIGSIESELTVIGAEDYSEVVNDFINFRIPAFFIIHRDVINVIVGEIIRYLGETFW